MNKKGFTLIELLAVILILGIIALIAIPAVTNAIEDSKKHAAEVTALSYIKAINDQNALYKLQPDKFTPITSGDVEDLEVNLKGDGPSTGTVTITNGKVTEAELCASGYTVTYNGVSTTVGNKCGITSNSQLTFDGKFNGTFVSPTASDTHKGIVYLNPTDLEVECNSANSQIGDGSANASGCMKFYIFNDETDNYKMILDHNTTARVAWNSTGTNETMLEAKAALDTDTEDWYGNPRLITADEIAHLVGADRNDTVKWNSSKEFESNGGSTDPEKEISWFYFDGSGSQYYTNPGWQKRPDGTSQYAWLFDYTDGCSYYGCNNNASVYTNGYWTSTTNSTSYVLYVRKECKLNRDSVTNEYYGIRPVIELPKRYFE